MEWKQKILQNMYHANVLTAVTNVGYKQNGFAITLFAL